MINSLTLVFAHFIQTRFDDFSERYSQAISIFELIESPIQADKKRIYEFQEAVSKEMPISLWILDRHINPEKCEFSTVNHFIAFEIKNSNGSVTEKRFTENQIQKALCNAMVEVNQIIMRNIKNYQFEMPIHTPTTEDKNLTELFNS
jgi:hypothetical protein